MTILRRIAALCILNLSFASGALGSTIQYSIDSGATLQLGSGPIEVLTGGLTIECPVENCISNGEVDFDIVSIDLQSLSFSETQSGLFEFVGTPSGGGFSIGRFLTLFDAGSISPDKDASLSYGFDAVLESSTPDFDRYRVWMLSGPGSYRGPFVPDSLSMQLILEETIIDLGTLGILDWTVAQTAQVEFAATLVVPEPSTALLMSIGLVGLGASRRRFRAKE